MNKPLSVELEIARLMSLCSKREYARKDILDKLLKRGFDIAESEQILNALENGKYLNDRRFAKAFAADKSILEGWGENKIVFRLRAKGIAPDFILEALEDIDQSRAQEKMILVLGNKWRQLLQQEDNIQKRKIKFLRFASSRGFSYTEALDALAIIEQQ